MVARKCKRLRLEDGTPPVRLRTELRKESKLLSPAIPRQTSERGVIVSKNGLPRKPLTKRRLKNLILNVLKNPFNMVVLVSLIILFCLIIIPLLTMISSTFTLAQGELRRVQGHVGDFTLYYWKYILTGTMANAVLWPLPGRSAEAASDGLLADGRRNRSGRVLSRLAGYLRLTSSRMLASQICA